MGSLRLPQTKLQDIPSPLQAVGKGAYSCTVASWSWGQIIFTSFPGRRGLQYCWGNGDQRGRVNFHTALLKLHCKAAEVHRYQASRAVFPLGHVLEGIAGRKSSWMSTFNRSASYYSGLSLTPVGPSLPLSLPLDKICLVGDMFRLRRYSDLNTHLPANHPYLHFYGFHGALFTV